MSLQKGDFIISASIIGLVALIASMWMSKIQYKSVTLRESQAQNTVYKMFYVKGAHNPKVSWNHVNFVKGFIETSYFSRSLIENTIFENVDLKGVNFSGSVFKNCTFKNVNMEDVSFYSAQLTNVVWKNVKCDSCDFRNTEMVEAVVEARFIDSFYNEKSLLPFSWEQLAGRGFQYRQ